MISVDGFWSRPAGSTLISRLTSDLAWALRRIERAPALLVGRGDEGLPFLSQIGLPDPALLDTTVYVHTAQNKGPGELASLLRGRVRMLHAAPCLSELMVALGALDPRHSASAPRKAVILDILRQVPGHRVVAPLRSEWCGAAALAGLLGRLRGLPKTAWRSLQNDALILLTARRLGATVVTANIADFDLLTQLVPDARVAFYRPL